MSSANPRLVDGKPSKNPRYLQQRPDRTNAEGHGRGRAVRAPGPRGCRAGAPLLLPGGRRAAGRRNNPPDGPVPPLCSYNPLHYMELPELFMEFISLDDRQVPLDDRRRLRGRADQGAVQRDAGRSST